LEQNSKPFSKFLKDLQEETSLVQDLNFYLIKPVQRICKYPLLLKAIFRQTPRKHPDFNMLKKAKEKMSVTVEQINEKTRIEQNLQKIAEIQASFTDFFWCTNEINLVDERRRRFICEGNFVKTVGYDPLNPALEKHHYYLFNDIFVFGQLSSNPSNENKFLPIGVIKLEKVVGWREYIKAPVLDLRLNNNKKLTLNFATIDDRTILVTELENLEDQGILQEKDETKSSSDASPSSHKNSTFAQEKPSIEEKEQKNDQRSKQQPVNKKTKKIKRSLGKDKKIAKHPPSDKVGDQEGEIKVAVDNVAEASSQEEKTKQTTEKSPTDKTDDSLYYFAM